MGRHYETVMTVLQLVEDLTRKCIWDTVDSHLSLSLWEILEILSGNQRVN